MKKSILTICAFLFFALTTKAYDNHGLWCNGRLTLDNGEVIEGEINYDIKFEVIQVRNNGTVRAFTAENIAHFTMFDPVKYRQRDFVAIDHQMALGYERKTLFEVITNGQIAVLRKTRYVRKPRATEDYRAPHVYLNTVCKHDYFAMNGSELAEINNFEAEVLPWMQRYEPEINRYIKDSKLKLKKIQEQMRVVNLYNQLCDKNRFENTQADLNYSIH